MATQYCSERYLGGDKLHLVISIHLSGYLDHRLATGYGCTPINFQLAILAELQRTTSSSASRATAVLLASAGVLAQLAGVTDSDVRREKNEKVAICSVCKDVLVCIITKFNAHGVKQTCSYHQEHGEKRLQNQSCQKRGCHQDHPCGTPKIVTLFVNPQLDEVLPNKNIEVISDALPRPYAF